MNARRKAEILELTGKVTTIAAALATIVAVGFGYHQFEKGQSLQRQAQAVDLFLKYNELMRTTQHAPGERDAGGWRENSAIAIAEAIFIATGDDKGWRKTVQWMLSNHREFLQRKDVVDCDTYASEFHLLLNEATDPDVCPRR